MKSSNCTTEPYFGYCIKCEVPLIKKKRKTDGRIFISCSRYPKCKVSIKATRVDYAVDELKVPWKINISSDAIDLLDIACQSKQEIMYLLGAGYYYFNEHLEKNKDKTEFIYSDSLYYESNKYNTIRFFDPFTFSKSSISALSFVPQFPFSHNSHHDFGVFYSCDHSCSQYDWKLLCAVEVDIHPKHYFEPEIDNYRDSRVSYEVIRLTEEADPLNWAYKIEIIYENLFL